MAVGKGKSCTFWFQVAYNTIIILGAGDTPGTCAHCKKKKQGCQYSPGKPACRQYIGSGFKNDCIPAPTNQSRSTSVPPCNLQHSAEVAKLQKRRSRNQLSTVESTPQSPEQSQHVKCQHQSKPWLRSGSNAKSLAIESPPLRSQASALEAIEEDNYEYHDYAPPDPIESFFFHKSACHTGERACEHNDRCLVR